MRITFQRGSALHARPPFRQASVSCVCFSRIVHTPQAAWIPDVGEATTPSTTTGAAADIAELIWSPLPFSSHGAKKRAAPGDEASKAKAPRRTAGEAASSAEAAPAPAAASAGSTVVGASSTAASLDDLARYDPNAAFLRRWSACEMQEEALAALWRCGDLAAAEAHMVELRRAQGPAAMTLGQYAALGATLISMIIEHRRDLQRVARALSTKAVPVSLNSLQRFYYTCFRRSAEGMQLCSAMDAELDQDDGLDDHCGDWTRALTRDWGPLHSFLSTSPLLSLTSAWFGPHCRKPSAASAGSSSAATPAPMSITRAACI